MLYSYELSMQMFFFFQAEDGIRDTSVTGVQTCALPICDAPKDVIHNFQLRLRESRGVQQPGEKAFCLLHVTKTEKCADRERGDRKSTRLNSSHRCISYAVFCLKKKSQTHNRRTYRRYHV